MVSPGEILAILGPSGSDKSTLLNALAGSLTQKHQGTVLANDRAFTSPSVKPLSSALIIRLPRTLSKKDKISAPESIISELRLHKCENTIIDSTFVRGVSGGDRNRVSIAHEVLMNPSLLILDEPTSGLDLTAVHWLLSTLGSLAHKGKMIEGEKGHQLLWIYRLCAGFPHELADFILDLASDGGKHDYD
ncbi:hypothetical protein C1H46_017212 [Malus baccata]|uniref:AAA+ ATPase domain-containing protein n=1 Tax=Malus baccata TaxID=106549 RepID=A0A540MEG2_MALBA|nr:hypothetical protein C1H46_017212 [Malus baccata]